MANSTHSPQFHHANNIWSAAQITKLLLTHFSPPRLGPNTLLSRLVSNTHNSSLWKTRDKSFTLVHKETQCYTFVWVLIVWWKTERYMIVNWMPISIPGIQRLTKSFMNAISVYYCRRKILEFRRNSEPITVTFILCLMSCNLVASHNLLSFIWIYFWAQRENYSWCEERTTDLPDVDHSKAKFNGNE
jgi:hypothetical protein